MQLAQSEGVHIHLTSTLNPDDESAVAPVIIRALALILDELPIQYALRVDAADGRTFTASDDHDAPPLGQGLPMMPASGHFDS